MCFENLFCEKCFKLINETNNRTESCKLQDVQLTTAALWERSLDFSDPLEVFENLRQSFKSNTGEGCLIRTTDTQGVCYLELYFCFSKFFCLSLGKLHNLLGFSYLSNADNTGLILGIFKVLDESCCISLLHYQEMPDLEVIINYGWACERIPSLPNIK